MGFVDQYFRVAQRKSKKVLLQEVSVKRACTAQNVTAFWKSDIEPSKIRKIFFQRSSDKTQVVSME